MRKHLLGFCGLLLVTGLLLGNAPAQPADTQPGGTAAVQLADMQSPARAPAWLTTNQTCACFTLCIVGDHCCPVVVNGRCTNECVPNSQPCPPQ